MEFLKALFGGITNDHDSSKEIMWTDAKSFDSKSSRRKQQNFCRLKCTRFLGFLKPHKNSHARVFSRFWNSTKIRVHVFSRVFETVEKFAGRCYRGFLKLFKTLAARVLSLKHCCSCFKQYIKNFHFITLTFRMLVNIHFQKYNHYKFFEKLFIL